MSEAADRPQNLGEEIANAVSHGAGALLALAAIPVLLVHTIGGGRPAVEIFAVSVFGATMLMMYLASTLYHALPEGPSRSGDRSHGADGARMVPGAHRGAKQVFWVLDHSAIYLLIAGTYTPFALGVLKDSWGWTVFAVIWGLAAAGVLLKSLGAALLHPLLSIAVYLGMGWLALAVVEPLFTELPRAGLYWLVAGGLAYTLGVVFFAVDHRFRYAHFTWHLFVLAGTACHFVAVLGYA